MSPILSDLNPACSAEACEQGRKPCPCPEACRVAPRERMGRTSRPCRLVRMLRDPYERAALIAAVVVLSWAALIALGAYRSAQ